MEERIAKIKKKSKPKRELEAMMKGGAGEGLTDDSKSERPAVPGKEEFIRQRGAHWGGGPKREGGLTITEKGSKLGRSQTQHIRS